MKLLLDTHAFLWMTDGDKRLSDSSAAAILDVRNTLVLSILSWWEISIKVSLGKLDLRPNWQLQLKNEMRRNGIEWLPVRAEHCERTISLPFHHRDPFDRLLIAQAQVEGLHVVTADTQFRPYDVPIVW